MLEVGRPALLEGRRRPPAVWRGRPAGAGAGPCAAAAAVRRRPPTLQRAPAPGTTLFSWSPQWGAKHMALWLYIVLGVVLAIFVLWLLSLINRFVRYENAIDNAWAQIDVQLQRRGELIPNLIETVKGYAKHEKAAIDSVTEARAAMMGASTREGKMKAEGLLEQALGRLFAIAEAYPDLKANTNFLSL